MSVGPDHIRLKENCACGATLEVEGHHSYVKDRQSEWVRRHVLCPKVPPVSVPAKGKDL